MTHWNGRVDTVLLVLLYVVDIDPKLSLFNGLEAGCWQGLCLLTSLNLSCHHQQVFSLIIRNNKNNNMHLNSLINMNNNNSRRPNSQITRNNNNNSSRPLMSLLTRNNCKNNRQPNSLITRNNNNRLKQHQQPQAA